MINQIPPGRRPEAPAPPSSGAGGMSARRFAVCLAALVLLAATLRGSFPLADPPWRSTVGVVWHDEGAWVHNARNRALTGEWEVDGDRWNPMYITPVLTGLEYLSFRSFGVGLWQARLVSAVMGVLAVLCLGLGVARLGGRAAGLVAAALLASNFVSVMYDRAALMEATMVSLVVASWWAYARASTSPRWGIAAGVAAVLAYFTKASAVFFVAALGIDAALAVALERVRRPAPRDGDACAARAGQLTVLGLLLAAATGLAVFVAPHWADYRFYNWQMSVVRKPTYSLGALLDRASWFPVVHDFFTRMWAVTLLALASGAGLFVRWRRVAPAERVLALWVVLGMAELVLHDVGNERRLVFLIPGLVGLAALAIARDRGLLDEEAARASLPRALVAAPVVFGGLYLLAGSSVRLLFMDQVHAGILRPVVRWSAAAAAAAGVAAYATWPGLPRLLARARWGTAFAVAMATAIVAADLWQFSQWATIRTYKNYGAMVAIGRWLPPGTAVHGKLANGLDLESRITPIFVGRGFGNYGDRARRPDVRYLLTYTRPKLGYESQAKDPVILDVLAACPGWRIVREFDVAETPGGRDRAALVDKYPDRK